MKDPRSVISYHTEEHGQIRIKLAEILDSRGITRNKLKTLTGVKYDMVTRYYMGESIERVDLDFLAKVCYVLDCEIQDLLEYVPPKQQE